MMEMSAVRQTHGYSIWPVHSTAHQHAGLAGASNLQSGIFENHEGACCLATRHGAHCCLLLCWGRSCCCGRQGCGCVCDDQTTSPAAAFAALVRLVDIVAVVLADGIVCCCWRWQGCKVCTECVAGDHMLLLVGDCSVCAYALTAAATSAAAQRTGSRVCYVSA